MRVRVRVQVTHYRQFEAWRGNNTFFFKGTYKPQRRHPPLITVHPVNH
jgi:hypothetical protein